MAGLTESVVEDAALAWLESLGYAVKRGPNITPSSETLTLTLSQWERQNYSQVVLPERLRQALVRLNPTVPAEAIDDAFRKIIRLEGATLDARNRTFHRLLVDGVTVEYRTVGSIHDALARLNPVLSTEAADDAFQRLTRPVGAARPGFTLRGADHEPFVWPTSNLAIGRPQRLRSDDA
jgi:type I site-specific restriction-modification system R (restriction) subunit